MKDTQGNPKANTPVKLIALSYGNQYWIKNTNSDGVAAFAMSNWPNQCPQPPCCPATWNAGDYRATAVDYCRSTDAQYDGSHLTMNITVGNPCLGEP